MAERVVHALYHGLPLCGFSNEVPNKWPEGHQWTDVNDTGFITCTVCQRKAIRKSKRKNG